VQKWSNRLFSRKKIQKTHPILSIFVNLEMSGSMPGNVSEHASKTHPTFLRFSPARMLTKLADFSCHAPWHFQACSLTVPNFLLRARDRVIKFHIKSKRKVKSIWISRFDQFSSIFNPLQFSRVKNWSILNKIDQICVLKRRALLHLFIEMKKRDAPMSPLLVPPYFAFITRPPPSIPSCLPLRRLPFSTFCL
jgi:hypothetical protein